MKKYKLNNTNQKKGRNEMEELRMYGSHSQPTEKNRWIDCYNQLLELEKENEELRE